MSPIILLLLGVVALYFVLRLTLNTRIDLSPEQAREAVASGTAVIVDVREPNEWRDGVAHGAALLPLTDLRGTRQKWRPFLEQHRDKRLLLYCGAGVRAGMAAATLKSEGFAAANIGSFARWQSRGLPVEKPE